MDISKPQTERHRSCFQTPAKDISVCMVLTHLAQYRSSLVMRYTDWHRHQQAY